MTGWRRTALFTDHYQLVMAQLYVGEGLAERPAQFSYHYRSNPDYGSHQAGFCVFAGLEPLLDWLDELEVTEDDVESLRRQRTPTGAPRFSEDFGEWFRVNGALPDVDLVAVPEGRVVHPYEPLITATGPLGQAQLLETALLNLCNYPTLVATKAARIAEAAHGAPVLEFGMRRGHGSGVDEGARAALIGGCSATSNVQAAVSLDREARGTHAHSMVQTYLALQDDDEREGPSAGELAAFRAFARHYPDECILLVDTVDTVRSGIPNAITVFEELRDAGHEPAGVRLDSGDLAHLAVQAAAQLDEAGFADARIVLSGELDELTIWQILTQIDAEARRDGLAGDAIRDRLVYGVGTRLITSAGDSSLGGVYKLTAVSGDDGEWLPALKLSETPAKMPIVGPNRTFRLHDRRGHAVVDLLMLDGEEPFAGGDVQVVRHPVQSDVSRRLRRAEIADWEELQVVDPRRPQDRPPVDRRPGRASRAGRRRARRRCPAPRQPAHVPRVGQPCALGPPAAGDRRPPPQGRLTATSEPQIGPVPTPLHQREELPGQLSGRAFARITSAYQWALRLGVRVNGAVRSTVWRPKCGPYPKAHSKLSSSDQHV